MYVSVCHMVIQMMISSIMWPTTIQTFTLYTYILAHFHRYFKYKNYCLPLENMKSYIQLHLSYSMWTFLLIINLCNNRFQIIYQPNIQARHLSISLTQYTALPTTSGLLPTTWPQMWYHCASDMNAGRIEIAPIDSCLA